MRGQIIERTTAEDRRQKQRRFSLRVYLGKDDTGRKLHHIETFIGKKPDAEEKLRELLARHGRGELTRQDSMSVGAFLDAWLKDALPGSVSVRTAQDYKRLINDYVRPALGTLPLNRLKGLQIQALYNAMRERDLSPRTIRFTHNVLNKALKQAVRWHYLIQNPAEAVQLPRPVRREMPAMSAEQVRDFLKAARGTRFEVLWQFALDTGMRPEEYLALRWSDLRDGAATVQRAVTRKISGGGYHFIPPKTPRARRSIPLSRETLAALERHRRRQNEARLALGDKWHDLDLVFPARDGTPMSGDNLRNRYFKPLLVKAKIPDMPLYALRHTCATLLMQHGVNPKIVAERLGHSSITITLDTYSHVLPSMQQQASDILERAIYKAK